MRGKRRTQAELMVIGALSQSNEPLMGYDLATQCRMNSGRVYLTLMGLHDHGKVERTCGNSGATDHARSSLGGSQGRLDVADYYARRNGVLIGPFGLYDEVTGWHAKQERHKQPRADDMAVLLNLGTLANGDPEDLLEVLKYDPVLKSIFELGRRVGLRNDDSEVEALLLKWHTDVGPHARNWPRSTP